MFAREEDYVFTFKSPGDMLDTLRERDLYSPNAGTYVFLYNDKDAICVYNLTTRQVEELVCKCRHTGEESWSSFLGAGGMIFDDWHDLCDWSFKLEWMDIKDIYGFYPSTLADEEVAMIKDSSIIKFSFEELMGM